MNLFLIKTRFQVLVCFFSPSSKVKAVLPTIALFKVCKNTQHTETSNGNRLT